MAINNEDISTILRILKQIPLMQELNEEDHKEIIKRITLEYFPKNYVVFKEGEPGDAFYIVKRGMVKVFHEAKDGGEEKGVAMLGDNDFFGEMALISDKPRNATTQTMEESEVFKLQKEDFIQLVSSNPNMAHLVSSEFLTRLKLNLREENE
ncbi:MAG TPA: cyclic nucleotide-binding domain-containing protein [Candidatus Gracilibacteria bacterium]|nr:cyclic nucleotide-binding domain-containing protein [Candidatus Gracilibacteria bacterium]